MSFHVGRHFGTSAEGETYAEVTEDGNIDIWVRFDNPNKKGMPSVGIAFEDWDRLVAWVTQQRQRRG